MLPPRSFKRVRHSVGYNLRSTRRVDALPNDPLVPLTSARARARARAPTHRDAQSRLSLWRLPSQLMPQSLLNNDGDAIERRVGTSPCGAMTHTTPAPAPLLRHVTPHTAAFSIPPARKLDLFDLPVEVLLHIFRDGETLLAAEGASQRWRGALRGEEAFWRGACNYAGLRLHESASAGGTPASARWRRTYMAARGRTCRHCGRALRYHLRVAAYGAGSGGRLCRGCRKLEPYCALTLSQARRYFALGRRTLPGDVAIPARTAVNGKAYSFAKLVQCAIHRFGPDKARLRADRARRELGIRSI